MKKRWLTLVALALACSGLGVWAWLLARDRDFHVVFGVSGDKAIEWAEIAKEGGWDEIVTSKFEDGRITYVTVPRNGIDAHVQSENSVLVRRWLPDDEAIEYLDDIDAIGYADPGGSGNEMRKALRSKKTRVRAIALGACASGSGALALGFVMARRSWRDRRSA